MTDILNFNENINSNTPAYWSHSYLEEKDDKLYYNDQVYAVKIRDINKFKDQLKQEKQKKIEHQKRLEELRKQEKQRKMEGIVETEETVEKTKETPTITPKKDTKKTKDNENNENNKKKSNNMYIDMLGDRTRHWGDIYCSVTNDYSKPFLLYKTITIDEYNDLKQYL